MRDLDAALERLKATGRLAARAVVAVGTAATAATGALVANSLAAAHDAEEIERLARVMGVSTRTLQEWGYVASTVGTDVDDIADAMATLADKSLDAADGAQGMIDDFRMIGLEVDDLRGKSPSQLFNLFADALSRTENQSVRIGATVRLLGDDLGRRLFPAVERGSAGLAALREEAHATGAVLHEDLIRSGRTLSREWRRTTQTFRGVRTELGLALAPALTDVARRVRAWVTENRRVISDGIDTFVERLGDAFRELNRRVMEFGGYRAAIEAVARALGTGALGFLIFQGASVARDLGLVVSAIGALFGGGLGAGAVALAALAASVALFVKQYQILRDFRAEMEERFPAATRVAAEAFDLLVSVGRLLASTVGLALRSIWETLRRIGAAIPGLPEFKIEGLDEVADLLDVIGRSIDYVTDQINSLDLSKASLSELALNVALPSVGALPTAVQAVTSNEGGRTVAMGDVNVTVQGGSGDAAALGQDIGDVITSYFRQAAAKLGVEP